MGNPKYRADDLLSHLGPDEERGPAPPPQQGAEFSRRAEAEAVRLSTGWFTAGSQCSDGWRSGSAISENGVTRSAEPDPPAINEGKDWRRTQHRVRELGYGAAGIWASGEEPCAGKKKPIGVPMGRSDRLGKGNQASRGTWSRGAYCTTISTRRFCGSRTPSPVCTRRPCSPRPTTLIACAGTPSRTRASLTALARRSDSAML